MRHASNSKNSLIVFVEVTICILRHSVAACKLETNSLAVFALVMQVKEYNKTKTEIEAHQLLFTHPNFGSWQFFPVNKQLRRILTFVTTIIATKLVPKRCS